MLLIDFGKTPSEAFAQGFLKGLGAPAVLFGRFEAPGIVKIRPLELPSKQDQESLADDWRKVGKDIQAAMATYEQERQTPAA